MNRILIAGTASGCGKTTVTCAVLSALRARGLDITAFKCGPDYIDPMFHRETAGVRTYNLDPFFLCGTELQEHLSLSGRGSDISVIEGAMGYYDGIAGTTNGSAYTVACATKTPVVLVADARGVGNSLAAVLEGFRAHRTDSGIRGVIFNNLSPARYPDMSKLAKSAGLIPLGFLPPDERFLVGSRHLGLVTAAEIGDIRQKLRCLGRTAEETIDLDGLLTLSSSVAPLVVSRSAAVKSTAPAVKIAIARDKAFCFMYRENLELIERCGGELVFFSPLEDCRLPPGIGALYLCGGYPELYLERLSGNKSMLEDIKNAINAKMPVIAECGGFMALHDTLGGYKMTGIINSAAYKTEKLVRFGYITLTAREDNLLCDKNDTIKAHEFHYWDSETPGDGFTARKEGRETEYNCVFASDTMYAGFPHIYLTENMARRFVSRAGAYAGKGTGL